MVLVTPVKAADMVKLELLRAQLIALEAMRR